MIDTQSIRDKILDLAFQGKLTEQLDSDSNIRQYLALKKINIASNENKDIPSTWCSAPLKQLSQISTGTSIPEDVKKENYQGYIGGLAYIGTKDVGFDHVVDYDNGVRIPNNEQGFVVAEASSVLLCIEGGSAGRKIAIIDQNVCYGNKLCKFYTTIISPYYLYYYLQSNSFKKIFKNKVTGLIGGVNLTTLKKLIIPVPPLTEQKRIVEKIEQVFSVLDAIDELQAQYADNLTVLKSKLIDLAIQGKLTEQRPEDGSAEELYQQIQAEKTDIIITHKGRKDNNILPIDEDVPFDVPNNWKWIRFGETGFFRKGPFGSSLTKSMFVPKSENTVKIYEQQHAINKDHTLGTYYITREYFDTSMKGFEVVPGDIIVSCAGTIGETYIMPETIECGIINQALMRITVVPSIDKRFFLYYFDSQLKSRAKDGNGMAITNIPPFDVLKNLYFPLPPLAEQKRIVDRLDKLLAVCDEMR